MLEIICAIPEEIGWAIVGFIACLCFIMAINVGKVIIQAIKARREENKFWRVYHCDDFEEEVE